MCPQLFTFYNLIPIQRGHMICVSQKRGEINDIAPTVYRIVCPQRMMQSDKN